MASGPARRRRPRSSSRRRSRSCSRNISRCRKKGMAVTMMLSTCLWEQVLRHLNHKSKNSSSNYHGLIKTNRCLLRTTSFQVDSVYQCITRRKKLHLSSNSSNPRLPNKMLSTLLTKYLQLDIFPHQTLTWSLTMTWTRMSARVSLRLRS